MLVHLVDGTYELFRSFFGAPSSIDSQGREVGATLGLARSLSMLLRQDDVTHVGIAFDTVIESFRNDLFDGYKTGEGIEPTLWNQFPLAERVAEAMGLAVWRMREFEADDALATAAAIADGDDRVEKVIIASPDKDLCQCVRGTRVVTWDRRRETFYDDGGVREKFGVAPASIPDYLGLVGDSADGIPGIPKWGAKSASTVLARYETIEAIPPDPANWDIKVRGAATLAANLNERRDDAILYRKLAVLRRDVPLEQQVDDWKWKGADVEALAALGQELGDAKLAQRVPGS